MIITRTPFRISFFGGGTDYPAWFCNHGGSVISTTIDKYCYISCRFLPPFFEHKHRIVYSQIENVVNFDEIQHPSARETLKLLSMPGHGLEIHHDGDLPARSGLGSSSAFTVGLVNALNGLKGRMVGKQELAQIAIHIEQKLILENVGSQDQVSAAYGGLNRIDFNKDETFDVSPIIITAERLNELASHLMLCFTGFSRIADSIAKTKINNIKTREYQMILIGQMVGEAIEILSNLNTPINEFGKLLDEGWKLKRSLSEKVSTPQIDLIYDEAKKAGAIGGKILGAGGGGFMLLFAKPEDHSKIREKLSSLVHVSFNFEQSGSKVVLYQPDGL